MTTETISPQLRHFLDLARQGRDNPCASSGEKQSHRLVAAITKNIPGLDGSAVTGLCEFTAYAIRSPMAGRDLTGA